MKTLDVYNVGIGLRWNLLFRRLFVLPKWRRRLRNNNFTILCNNCNAGVITHDLGQAFNSPTVNLFFYGDHFFKFCENFEYYINQTLEIKDNPIYKPESDYPVCALGDLELHFMHYNSFDEAKKTWDRRLKRISRNNIFVMWTFFSDTSDALLERFEHLPFKNKVAFTERNCPNYPSSFWIRGFPDGLGVLTRFYGLSGKRIIDQFDYVAWLNGGK